MAEVWFQADIYVRHEITRKDVILSVVRPLYDELSHEQKAKKFHFLPAYFDPGGGERARKIAVRFLIADIDFELVDSKLRELLSNVPGILACQTERQNFAALKNEFKQGWPIIEDLLEYGSKAALSLLDLYQEQFIADDDFKTANPYKELVWPYVNSFFHYFLFQLFYNRSDENEVYARKIAGNIQLMAKNVEHAKLLV